MNSNTFRMPARRPAALLACATLAVGPLALLAATPAHATETEGKASAVVLRAALDVSLLNKAVEVPLSASLNEVHAPAHAEQTALTVNLDGVDGGRPFSLVKADVATAEASTEPERAEAHSNLSRATVHVPGLPLLSMIRVEEVTAKAVCAAGEKPTAESNVLGAVTVLGKRVTLTAGGPTRVKVPAVGEVRLDLSRTQTTSQTAAATALRLKVAVNPLNLNVAEVEGEIVLAAATCTTPATAKPSQKPTPAATPRATAEPADVKAQSGGSSAENLAETGGSSTTAYLAGGAMVLLGAGAGSLILTRRGRGGA
ncbi:SCO1860 family LAETG-anchored protein [Streptomyces sp. NPDC006879]|uniref:SCO1860 family LAETG-anchored protein n=1 Tax=Streptomyces sp. NPDC006879 TaxID=3364767 RepID=UPI0036821C9F